VKSRRAGHLLAGPARRLGAVTVLVVLGVVAPPAAFAAPTNDDFAAARSLGSAPSGTVTGVNVAATKQPGEPEHAGNAGGRSVWFSWTAPTSGSVSFSTGASDFDTVLAVYTGSAVGALTAVASNDDLGFQSTSAVSFHVSGGVTYSVAVDGSVGKNGRIGLSWAPAPANDNFIDAQLLPSAGAGSATGTTNGATREPGEPESDVPVGRIWYSWTAPATGTYKLDTVGSRVDTVLGVYRGSSLETLTLVGLNDDDPDRGCCSSWVPIRRASAGTTFSIFVAPLTDEPGTTAGAGFVRLNWGRLVLGSTGRDRLVGTAGNEELRGGPGNDVLRGQGGQDLAFGGAGDDEVHGGAGNDVLVDHRGTNQLFGNAGADRLDARGGRADLLNGGPGKDRCVGDRNDRKRRCP
jgi:Ca2+-binding RTX toxin-like protein